MVLSAENQRRYFYLAVALVLVDRERPASDGSLNCGICLRQGNPRGLRSYTKDELAEHLIDIHCVKHLVEFIRPPHPVT